MILHASLDAGDDSTRGRLRSVSVGFRTTSETKTLIETVRRELGLETVTDVIEVALLTMGDDYYGLRTLDEVRSRQGK